MLRDLKYAVQSLWRSRTFAAAAILALGLAMGANATIFGLIDGLWLRPPGIPHPRELTRVLAVQGAANRGAWSFAEFRDFQTMSAFSGVVAKGGRGALLHEGGGVPDLLLVNVVSTNFFTVLGVNALHGRVFTPGDEAALDAQPGVVLGHAFWRRRFGGDPAIVGRTITLGRTGEVPVLVLGVLPPSFRDLDAAGDRDLWLPPVTWTRLDPGQKFERRDDRWFGVFARRRAPSESAAQAEASALVANWAREYPAHSAGRTVRVVSDDSYRLEIGGVSAFALLGLVLLVVLITCVNLANLLLARAAARTREIATRVALGASRWRVARQMLAESVVLGACGGAAGIAIAAWSIHLLPAVLPQPPGMPPLMLFQVDGRVLVFTLIVSFATTLLFGLMPCWIAARGDVVMLIKSSSAVAGSRRAHRFTRSVLVAGQIAVSLVLLTAAGVLARNFMAARSMEIGFDRKPIVTAWCALGDAPQAAAIEGLARLQALPGVSSVAVAVRAPLSLSGGGMAQGIWLPETPPRAGEGLPQVRYNAVSANYFTALGTRLRRGRAFAADDERPGEPVIVINEAFADRFFPGRDPIDRRVRLRSNSGVEHRIIGIVENGVVSEITDKNAPYFYLPYWRGRYGDLTYLVVPAGEPANLQAAIRDTLKSIHPALEPRRQVTMAEYTDYASGLYKTTATLASSLGFLGLLLTAIGVYGVVAYTTARRTREIGVRLALGAAPRAVMALVLRDGLRFALIGIAAGLPVALWLTRLLKPVLLGVKPWDLAVFGGASVVLVAAVVAATLIPAWSATRLSPSAALRTD
jgi:putative ABC transport system permease protein